MSLALLRERLHDRANLLSAPATRWLARVGVTPDGVTIAGLALSAAAAGCLAGGALRSAGAVWLVGSALDLLDGALARQHGMAARKGAFLDSSLDRISEGLVLTAAVYYFAAARAEVAAAISAYALVASFMVSYTRARAEALGANCNNGLATRAERVVIIGAGLLFNVLLAALSLLAVLATVTTVQRLLSVRSRLSHLEKASSD